MPSDDSARLTLWDPLGAAPGRDAYNRIKLGMPTGRVKFFNTDRGFGFILPDDGGPDVFVHVHEVEAAGMKMLVADQLVVYELAPRAMAA